MSTSTAKPHMNTITYGPCHYYRLRGEDGVAGHRVIFRANEIKRVDPTPLGAIVVLRGFGAEYKVTSPTPDEIS